MNAANVFSDTNIFICAYSVTEPEKKAIAVNILKQPVTISIQVINEFHWVMHRKYGVALSTLQTINQALFSFYRIQEIGQATIDQALTLAQTYHYIQQQVLSQFAGCQSPVLP
jgi:predicted nucleic acid-binding protein